MPHQQRLDPTDRPVHHHSNLARSPRSPSLREETTIRPSAASMAAGASQRAAYGTPRSATGQRGEHPCCKPDCAATTGGAAAGAGGFETIHPFLDGNGRVGRLLITVLLTEKGILQTPVLHLSHPFKQHRQADYDHLQAVREQGRAAANSLVARLEALGILREMTGQKRNRRDRTRRRAESSRGSPVSGSDEDLQAVQGQPAISQLCAGNCRALGRWGFI